MEGGEEEVGADMSELYIGSKFAFGRHSQIYRGVLHMDRNDYYGGESTSLNLTQVEASTNQVAEKQISVYQLPSKILCRVIDVQLKVEADTDEVFEQVILLPESNGMMAKSAIPQNAGTLGNMIKGSERQVGTNFGSKKQQNKKIRLQQQKE
ncbi:hypothetical protein GIB67_043053 [Kingdonia uniflora]|uniref:Uncharacterized protein n=1 Tax=Kingdonia uniflora TaxID=39325 RepID=A0A7J7NJS9_9MAGN|nr:hypothetical protein GIB67_043053 [Kingdonia uniflora]